jgi:hypothetical protein
VKNDAVRFGRWESAVQSAKADFVPFQRRMMPIADLIG